MVCSSSYRYQGGFIFREQVESKLAWALDVHDLAASQGEWGGGRGIARTFSRGGGNLAEGGKNIKISDCLPKKSFSH